MPKTFYAVTFAFCGKKMFAYYGNKPRGMYPPEPRCIFKDKYKAERLKRFMEIESTFKDIKVEERKVN